MTVVRPLPGSFLDSGCQATIWGSPSPKSSRMLSWRAGAGISPNTGRPAVTCENLGMG